MFDYHSAEALIKSGVSVFHESVPTQSHLLCSEERCSADTNAIAIRIEDHATRSNIGNCPIQRQLQIFFLNFDPIRSGIFFPDTVYLVYDTLTSLMDVAIYRLYNTKLPMYYLGYESMMRNW